MGIAVIALGDSSAGSGYTQPRRCNSVPREWFYVQLGTITSNKKLLTLMKSPFCWFIFTVAQMHKLSVT
jgi:hypothetical protein